MLALIHHLAISSAIPYSEIFNLAAQTTKRYLIVELLEHTDPMVVLLARQRDRMPEDFTLVKQLQTLEIHFSVLEQVPLVGSTRQLLLLEKK
jgi:formyltetrahydrofolate hydrolase